MRVGEDIVPVLRAERLLVHLVDRLAAVEHRDQVAQERQAGIGQFRDQGHRFLDVDDALGTVILGLERDDQEVAGDQRGPGAEMEIRRAVDQDQVVAVAHRLDDVPEADLQIAVGRPRLGVVVLHGVPRAGHQVDPGESPSGG